MEEAESHLPCVLCELMWTEAIVATCYLLYTYMCMSVKFSNNLTFLMGLRLYIVTIIFQVSFLILGLGTEF